MKTKEEIIEHIKKDVFRGMHKLYLNGLLFCLGREDLGISYGENMTEKRIERILNVLEEKNELTIQKQN